MISRSVLAAGLALGLSSLAFAATAPAASERAAEPESAGSLLEKGREALATGDLEKAQRFFSGISFQNPLWREKVEDLLRYHLLRGSSEEAWRLVQVLRRTGDEREVLNDYERLALFESRACPLAIPAGHGPSGHLLSAATYRLLFIRGSASLSPSAREESPSESGSHLVAGLTPYLKDIPSTKVLKGRGCRFEKLRLTTKEDLLKAEGEELVEFLKSDKQGLTLESQAELVIVSRLLQLLQAGAETKSGLSLRDKATRVRFEAVASQSLKTLAPTLAWEKMPDGDRRLIFRHLFGSLRLAEIPAERRAEASAIALRVLESEPTAAAADWLALVETQNLPAAKKIRLYSRLESLGSFAGRGWVMLELAWARAEKGEAREALAILRRLLLENEERLEPELEASAVELATTLVAEHRFDLKLQGAIRSALPSRLWFSLLEDLQLRLALKGERGELDQVVKLVRENASAGTRYAAITDLHRALAARDLGAFRQRVRAVTDRELMTLASQFAGRMPSLGEGEVAQLQVYFTEVAGALRKRLKSWDSRWDRLSDAIHVLEPESSAAKMGAQSVRKGTVQMGLARWRRPELAKPPFELKVPETLPLHALIMIPDSIGGRGWKLTFDQP